MSPDQRIVPLDQPAVRMVAAASPIVFRPLRDRHAVLPPLAPRALSTILLI